MGLVRGFHCCVWGCLAVLLYGSPANFPDQDVKAALADPDARAAFVRSDAALDGPDVEPLRAHLDVSTALSDLEARAALHDSDAGAAFADAGIMAALPDQVVKVALASPDVNVSSREASDYCLVAEGCIDQYLWSVYERARKVDTVKVREPIRVTVKKKGKSRTVTKTVTKLVDEDFTWKDPKAAEKAGMSLPKYVIGGMNRDFKMKLYHLLRALDDAGLAPGMTSGFRDDYRQSIASGNKAASDSSYHGGSRRGGYGHGLAADVVSVKGETRSERWSSSETLWKWIDAHGQEFGIGRPYLDKDPPHLGPIDGKEYADKRGSNAKRAGL